MNATEKLTALKNAVEIQKGKGSKAISTESLLLYLNELDASSDGDALERIIQREEHVHQWNMEMVRSGVEAGTSALKACLLISGGSAAALLAFAGSAWSSLKPEGLDALALTLSLLGWAILSTGLASAFTYLAQYFFAERLRWHERAGDLCQWVACTLVVLAYVCVGTAYVQVGSMLKLFNVVRPFTTG